MDKIFRDIFRMIFKTKIRSFGIWYIFGYLVCVYYGYTKFYRISIYPLFPIKLVPIVWAMTMGEMFYYMANQISFSVEKSQRKFKRRMVALIVCTMLVALLLRFTGISLAWVII